MYTSDSFSSVLLSQCWPASEELPQLGPLIGQCEPSFAGQKVVPMAMTTGGNSPSAGNHVCSAARGGDLPEWIFRGRMGLERGYSWIVVPNHLSFITFSGTVSHICKQLDKRRQISIANKLG